MIRFLWIMVCLSYGCISSFAQSLPFDELKFIRQLKQNHPVLESGRMQIRYGEEEIRSARGLFDPVIGGGYASKHFDEKLYYNKSYVFVDQPLAPLGMNVHAGFDANSGLNLNPENISGVTGQGYAGISLPLLQGRRMDDRRARLQVAQLYLEGQELQYQMLLNDLLLDALQVYWEWTASLNKLKILEEVLANNDAVLEGMKRSFEQGEIPAIDTLEAFLQNNRIRLQYQAMQLNVNLIRRKLQEFLWENPQIPSSYSDVEEFEIWENAQAYRMYTVHADRLQYKQKLSIHPIVKDINNAWQQLTVYETLEKEQLKPRLDIHANLLFNPQMSFVSQPWLNDNHQYGFRFQMPLWFRTAKGRVEQIKVQQQQNRLELNNVINALENQLEAALFAVNNISEQMNLFEQMQRDSERLYRAEIQKFSLGESSVFLVNNREIQYLQVVLSTIDMKAMEIIQMYQFLHRMGVLYTIVEE